jgi:hypothetical protein
MQLQAKVQEVLYIEQKEWCDSTELHAWRVARSRRGRRLRRLRRNLPPLALSLAPCVF